VGFVSLSQLELEQVVLLPIGKIALVHGINQTRSSYVITFFFTVITAAVLAETCSALPAAGSIYLYLSRHYQIDSIAGLLNRVEKNTVVSSASLSHGGPQQHGQPSVPQNLKAQRTTYSPKSMYTTFLFQQVLSTSNSALSNGSWLKLFSPSPY
jgi:hypothetical protein